MAQTDKVSFREEMSKTKIVEDENEGGGFAESEPNWINVDPDDFTETYEEVEFDYAPVDDEKLEFKNERKIYALEMSRNMKSVMQATAISQDRLIEMKKTGKPVMATALAQKAKEHLTAKMGIAKMLE